MHSIVYWHLIMLSVPINTGKAHSLVADEGDGLQMWKAADENTHISCHRQSMA